MMFLPVRRRASTSPDCERECFVADIKAAHGWLLEQAQRKQAGGSSWVSPASYVWNMAEHAWREVQES